MPNNIKPSEVSEVLLQQLKGVNTSVGFEEVGTVLQVSDGVARLYGLKNVTANELLEFENGTMAVAMNLEEDNVGVVLLGPTEGIEEGMTAKRTGKVVSSKSMRTCWAESSTRSASPLTVEPPSTASVS